MFLLFAISQDECHPSLYFVETFLAIDRRNLYNIARIIRQLKANCALVYVCHGVPHPILIHRVTTTVSKNCLVAGIIISRSHGIAKSSIFLLYVRSKITIHVRIVVNKIIISFLLLLISVYFAINILYWVFNVDAIYCGYHKHFTFSVKFFLVLSNDIYPPLVVHDVLMERFCVSDTYLASILQYKTVEFYFTSKSTI